MFISKIIKLPEGSKLRICKGDVITLMSRTKYIVESCDSPYYKMVFNDHTILVVSPDDSYMYYGRIVPPIPYDYPTPNSVVLDGTTFISSTRDIQHPIEVEFGTEDFVERDVDFTDYQAENDKNKVLSVAIVLKDGSRADVLATVVKGRDIKLA